MVTELAVLAAGAGETAIAEAAAETAVAAAELEGVKDLMVLLEDAAVPVSEVFSDFESVAGPVKVQPRMGVIERTLANGAKGELTLEALEALETAELAEEVELAEELSQYEKLNDLAPEQITPRVGRSAVPLMRGSYAAQVSRLSERAAVALKDAALRRNAEAALAEDLAQAEALQKTAALLEDISHLSDVAGDYLGIASYPEFMLHHSPGNK